MGGLPTNAAIHLSRDSNPSACHSGEDLCSCQPSCIGLSLYVEFQFHLSLCDSVQIHRMKGIDIFALRSSDTLHTPSCRYRLGLLCGLCFINYSSLQINVYLSTRMPYLWGDLGWCTLTCGSTSRETIQNGHLQKLVNALQKTPPFNGSPSGAPPTFI